MRSRAGSEQLLLIGMTLLLVLLLLAFLLAPSIAAAATTPRTAPGRRFTAADGRDVWRRRSGSALLALVTGVTIYAARQLLGYALAEIVPHVRTLPSVDGASVWIIDYPAYALQAVLIYAITTLACAVYGAWILALREPQAVNQAAISPAATTR